MKINVFWLIIGIGLICLDILLGVIYDNVGVTVPATVTNIETWVDSDNREHTDYYGDYIVNGKEYKNKKLKIAYRHSVGSTVDIKVFSNFPALQVPNMEGIFMSFGVLLIIINIFILYRKGVYEKFE